MPRRLTSPFKGKESQNPRAVESDDDNDDNDHDDGVVTNPRHRPLLSFSLFLFFYPPKK